MAIYIVVLLAIPDRGRLRMRNPGSSCLVVSQPSHGRAAAVSHCFLIQWELAVRLGTTPPHAPSSRKDDCLEFLLRFCILCSGSYCLPLAHWMLAEVLGSSLLPLSLDNHDFTNSFSEVGLGIAVFWAFCCHIVLSLSLLWAEALEPCARIIQEVHIKYAVSSCRGFYSVDKGGGGVCVCAHTCTDIISTNESKPDFLQFEKYLLYRGSLSLNVAFPGSCDQSLLDDGCFTNASWGRSFPRGSYPGLGCPLTTPAEWGHLLTVALLTFFVSLQQILPCFHSPGRVARIFLWMDFAAPHGTFQS